MNYSMNKRGHHEVGVIPYIGVISLLGLVLFKLKSKILKKKGKRNIK